MNPAPFCFRPLLRIALLLLMVGGGGAHPARAALDAPVSPNALPEVGALMRFLKSIEGDYVLSGQQEIAWNEDRAEEHSPRGINRRRPHG